MRSHNRIISPRPLTVPVLMSSLPLEDTCLDSPAPSSAPSSAPPLAVTDSATFVMVSEAGGAGASAEIVLQQVAGELDRVNFGPCV